MGREHVCVYRYIASAYQDTWHVIGSQSNCQMSKPTSHSLLSINKPGDDGLWLLAVCLPCMLKALASSPALRRKRRRKEEDLELVVHQNPKNGNCWVLEK